MLSNPRYLTLKLTNSCNLNCAMCGQRIDSNRNNGEFLDFQLIKDIIDDNADIKYVYLFGGEPLLYPYMKELLQLLGERKKIVCVTTNGILLEKYARDIVLNNVSRVEVSLDSHDKNRLKEIRGKDILESVVKGVEKLCDEKVMIGKSQPLLSINYVILPSNYFAIPDFVSFIESEMPGVSEVFFQYPMITTEQQGMKHGEVLEKEFNTKAFSYKWFINPEIYFDNEQLNELEKILISVSNKERVAFNGFKNKVELKEMISGKTRTNHVCECPFKSATVMPNGDVTFCTDYPDIILGSIKNDSLSTIWNNDTSKKFRELMVAKGNLPICSSCFHIDEVFKE